MAHLSPLNSLHEQAEASFLVYGPAADGAPVVETYGEIEAEYAALRKGCILLDCPQTATLWITGSDRLGFLNRMITQELADLKPYQIKHSFWLNRKGRIDADLRLTSLPPRPPSPQSPPSQAEGISEPVPTDPAGEDLFPFDDEGIAVALDILSATGTIQSLEAFIIADDVTITDLTDRTHRLSLHGPNAAALLQAVSAHHAGPPIADLNNSQSCLIRIAGHRLLVERDDVTGEVGLHLTMALEHVPLIYNLLVEVGQSASANHRLRPAGWHAMNIARIEAGTPIFNIDFGTDNLPAETGVLNDRVSFRKGCYLGQEVVARMHALGHPKQMLIALRIPRQGHEDNAWQPATGSPIYADTPPESGEREPKAIGRITSSARAPMLGDDILAFAQVRWGHHEPGTTLRVQTAAGLAAGRVNESLTSYSRP